jgi:hypothetical protein
VFTRKNDPLLFFFKASQNKEVLDFITDRNLIREYTSISSVEVISIRASIINISFSTIDIETISFGKNPIRGGIPPSIIRHSITIDDCFFLIWVFILSIKKGIIMATIMI